MTEPRRDDNDERLARLAGKLLRRSADELDAATLSRLNRARQRALAELDRRPARLGWLPRGWQASAALATIAAIAVAVVVARGPAQNPDSVARGERTADVEVLLADENLEMLDDLDFYESLPSEEPATGAIDG